MEQSRGVVGRHAVRLRGLSSRRIFRLSHALRPHELTIQVQDYATMPITDVAAGKGMNSVYLSRVNFLHEEPGTKQA